jgi:hypothetical protein
MHGPFQLLEDHMTEFGPGEPGYLGGRWWVDNNHNGMQDASDTYLLCPSARTWADIPVAA